MTVIALGTHAHAVALRAIDTVADLVQRYRFRAADEAQLHQGLQRVFEKHGIAALHEHPLSLPAHEDPTPTLVYDEDSLAITERTHVTPAGMGRVDFWLPDEGVVIEVKVGGGSMDLARQIQRYAYCEGVHGILVITTRLWHAELPPTLNKRPLRVVVLRQQSF
jgi:hypothetical protein